ncbi:hypothetical protein XV62_003175 [Escherichia coli]|nr:hypothetical protein [Escherichia coli]EFL5600509.1 hypothetical protein [Escherichia coli]EGK5685452.1 hypothetical protein [Escherichia coli]
MMNEYQIAIFGTVIKSQDGLFRLDEIRREGISIGKVEDNESTQYKRFAQTKVGKFLRTGREIRLVNMGELGTSILASPAAACEFARWLDFEYGLAVSKAFMAMTNLEAVQVAVAESVLPETVKTFVADHKEREKDNRQYVHSRLKRRNWG